MNTFFYHENKQIFFFLFIVVATKKISMTLDRTSCYWLTEKKFVVSDCSGRPAKFQSLYTPTLHRLWEKKKNKNLLWVSNALAFVHNLQKKIWIQVLENILRRSMYSEGVNWKSCALRSKLFSWGFAKDRGTKCPRHQPQSRRRSLLSRMHLLLWRTTLLSEERYAIVLYFFTGFRTDVPLAKSKRVVFMNFLISHDFQFILH